ncbi:MAG: tyrosine-type recombinase/integrase [Chloroflexi bacterium]|nr:tyrosine-type recombinase/integrase [Chloroflexota bacterium]
MENLTSKFTQFLQEEKKYSQNTIDAYTNDLNQLFNFVNNNNNFRKWSDINSDLIQSYFLELRAKSYAAATTARKVAATRSFFNFLINQGIMEIDPTEGITRPQVHKLPPEALSLAQIDQLLKEPDKITTPEGKRDKAMLELLCATGLRVSELIALNIIDINLSLGRLCCIGKASKERYIDFGEQAAKAVGEYLTNYRPQLVHNQNEQALFVNRRGQRLTRQGFWLILKSYAKKAQIDKVITPHTLRHSKAIHSLTSGKMNLKELQEFLGHANISTTQMYEKSLDPQ